MVHFSTIFRHFCEESGRSRVDVQSQSHQLRALGWHPFGASCNSLCRPLHPPLWVVSTAVFRPSDLCVRCPRAVLRKYVNPLELQCCLLNLTEYMK